jgi:hypothetical protein
VAWPTVRTVLPMGISRTVAAAAGAATLVALAGCAALPQRRLDFSHTEQVKITEIVLRPGSGSLVVHTAPVSNVEVKRVVRYGGDEPGPTYRVEGTVLTLDTDCGWRCSVSYTIRAPQGVAVRGENGSGDIELNDVAQADVKVGSGSITVTRAAGAVKAQTGSGDVTVAESAGPVWVRTGSGSVEGVSLGAAGVDATTGSGDISLTLNSPGPVRARAGSGSVELTVPAGAYRLSTRTGSGSMDVRIPSDPGAPHLLDIETGSGDITLSQR